jgi:hypothetical protein
MDKIISNIMKKIILMTALLAFISLFAIQAGQAAVAAKKPVAAKPDYKSEAKIIYQSGTDLNKLLKYLKKKRDTKAMAKNMETYANGMERNDKSLKKSELYAINNFITYGIKDQINLTEMERVYLVVDYVNKYKKYPKTEADWQTIMKVVFGYTKICEKNTHMLMKTKCFKDTAIAKKDVTYCDKYNASISGFDFTCYYEVAKATKNSKVCDKITNYWNLKSCYDFLSLPAPSPEKAATASLSDKKLVKSCSESDGGKNKDVRGTVWDGRGKANYDSCLSTTTLKEFYCDRNTNVGYAEYECPGGCFGGVCKSGKSISILGEIGVMPSVVMEAGKDFKISVGIKNNSGQTKQVSVSAYDQDGWGGMTELSLNALDQKLVWIDIKAEEMKAKDNPHVFTVTANNESTSTVKIYALQKDECIDSDGGQTYGQKGFTAGWTVNGASGYNDVCYQDYWANLVDSCFADGCYLAEAYCWSGKVEQKLKVECKGGCIKGVCITSTSTP